MKRFRMELIELICRYRLDQRTPQQNITGVDWRQVLLLARRFMISDDLCKAYLFLIEKDVEHLTDFPDYLHRLPEPEQLYRDGRPHIRIGALADDPELEVGFRFDGPVFCLVAGLTGYGKTTAIRVILRAIHQYNLQNPEKKIVVIVLDRKGGDYADLPAMFGWKHFDNYSTLRLSLENPPGVPPQVWINIVSTLFCARAGLKAAWATMANALRYLLALLNPNPTQRLIWPDFQLLLDFLRSIPETTFSSKSEYTRSLIQALEAITKSSSQTFRAFQGFRLDGLIAAGQSAVISVSNSEPSWGRQLVSDMIFCYELKSRIHSFHRVNRTEVIFVGDEMDSDIHQHAEIMFDDQMCPISQVFKQGREFGLGMVVSISSLRSASRLVLENATHHIMFRSSNYESAVLTAQTLMLPKHGILSLQHLEKGQALVKQIGPWPHAIKVQIDSMPPSRVHITLYDSHPYLPAKRIHQLPAVMEAAKALRDAHDKRKQRRIDKDKEIGDKAKTVLKLAIAHPYVPVARLFDKIGDVNFSTQKAIRREIADEELAEFAEVRIGKTTMLLIELKDAAYRLLGQEPPTGENRGRGKLVHRSLAHWIKQYLAKQERQAFLEWVVPGTNHPVDVAVEAGELWDAYEVCVTASDNLGSHIAACFEVSQVVRKLFVVTTQAQIAKQLRQQVLAEVGLKPYISNIVFESIQNYIPKEI